jgi:hypothetical protein
MTQINCYILIYKPAFLSTSAKLREVNISFVMFVRPSVHLHGVTRLPLEGFSLNLIFEDFF